MIKENNQLKRGIILNYINLGLGNLIPIFYTPIMLALLGQEEYGLYKLSTSVTSYLSLISLGIGSAVTRYLIKARTEEGKDAEESMLGLFIFIFRGIAVVSLIVGCFLVFNLDALYSKSLNDSELFRMKILVLLMVCNTALNFSFSPYISVVSAHEKFVFLQGMNIVSTCGVPILNLVVLCFGYASIGMTAISLGVSVFTRYMYLYYVGHTLSIKPQFKKIPANLLKEILSFSFWVFVANIVGQLYSATDTVLIGAIPALGTIGVAVYNVGAVFNNIVFSLTTGVSSLMGPKTTKMVFSGASNQELTCFAIKVGRIQCYIISLIVTGFIAFGKPFIEIYAGSGYEDSYWVAILMMVPNMIPLVQSVCLSIIVAKNKHRFRSLVYLAIAVINVIGSWFALQIAGVIGAALVTGIAVVLGQGIVMNWYYGKKTGLDMKRFWKEVSTIYVIPCMMCCITLFLGIWIDYYKIGYMILGIALYTIIYCFLNWRLILNDYEKSLLYEPMDKLLKYRRG